jgi:NADP-dependent 3-hydroxy acid dehydrogenase YdfG
MKIAVIIGVSATEGLGAAAARKFSANGLHVVVAGRTSERLEEVVTGITDQGGQASAFVADATDSEALEKLMTFADSKGGQLLAPALATTQRMDF